MSPLRAIRQHCLLCMNGSTKFVRECHERGCPLHTLRMGRAVKGVSPLRSIRALCVDCQGGSYEQIRECNPNLNSGEVCPLHAFRFGKRPQNKQKFPRQEPVFEAEAVSEE